MVKKGEKIVGSRANKESEMRHNWKLSKIFLHLIGILKGKT